MTEIEALHKTILLWDYLYMHPSSLKSKAYKALGFEPDENYCPLCEYANQKSGTFVCKHCPLLSFWPKAQYSRYLEQPPCCRVGSAYAKWNRISDTESAGQIVEAAYRRLKEITT